MNQSDSKLKRGWQIINSSWQVLKLDKEILLLPIIQFFTVLAIIAVSVWLFVAVVLLGPDSLQTSGQNYSDWLSYAVFALFVLATTFVANVFTGAIFHAAFERFDGKDPTLKTSLSAAWAKKWSLFLFSILSVTVGLLLNLIRERVPFGGRLVAWLGDLAWSVASFFSVAVIIRNQEKTGPIDATKQSLQLIKRVWGESLIVNIGIGLVAFLGAFGYIAAAGGVVFGLAQVSSIAAIIAGIVGVIGLVMIGLLATVLTAVAKAAIYYWATTGKAPATFQTELLRSSLTQKKARKIFA